MKTIKNLMVSLIVLGISAQLAWATPRLPGQRGGGDAEAIQGLLNPGRLQKLSKDKKTEREDAELIKAWEMGRDFGVKSKFTNWLQSAAYFYWASTYFGYEYGSDMHAALDPDQVFRDRSMFMSWQFYPLLKMSDLRKYVPSQDVKGMSDQQLDDLEFYTDRELKRVYFRVFENGYNWTADSAATVLALVFHEYAVAKGVETTNDYKFSRRFQEAYYFLSIDTEDNWAALPKFYQSLANVYPYWQSNGLDEPPCSKTAAFYTEDREKLNHAVVRFANRFKLDPIKNEIDDDRHDWYAQEVSEISEREFELIKQGRLKTPIDVGNLRGKRIISLFGTIPVKGDKKMDPVNQMEDTFTHIEEHWRARHYEDIRFKCPPGISLW